MKIPERFLEHIPDLFDVLYSPIDDKLTAMEEKRAKEKGLESLEKELSLKYTTFEMNLKNLPPDVRDEKFAEIQELKEKVSKLKDKSRLSLLRFILGTIFFVISAAIIIGIFWIIVYFGSKVIGVMRQ